MKYELEFLTFALKGWKRLGSNTRQQFRRKLRERCDNPHVPYAKLLRAKDRYKIKLKSVGYRLVYEVEDRRLVVVVAICKREGSAAYEAARKR